MDKMLILLKGLNLPTVGTSVVFVCLVALVGGVGFVAYDYSERGIEIEKLQGEISVWENEKKQWVREQMSLMDVQDSLRHTVQNLEKTSQTDKKNYAEREAQLQLTLKQVIQRGQDALQKAQAKNDTLESYVEKLESGNYEVKMGVWPFKSKRLVPKK
jgi:chromosome segregation ATPase